MAVKGKFSDLYHHPLWNMLILTIGAGLITLGIQGITAHHGFLTGGIMGMGLLISYTTGLFTAPFWNLIINIPLLMFSWLKISRRFVIYSLYGTVAIYVWGIIIGDMQVPIKTPLYAAILSGSLVGLGGGIMLRSLGSSGGLDLIGVYLNQRWGIAIGGFAFAFNAVLFTMSMFTISLDLIVVSFIQIFIVANVTDYVLGLFNHRKMVFIITVKGQEVCYAITGEGGRATLVPAYGGYSHDAKEMVMTVTTNYAVRHLEDIVYRIDPNALFAVENTFYVSGAQYPRKSK